MRNFSACCVLLLLTGTVALLLSKGPRSSPEVKPDAIPKSGPSKGTPERLTQSLPNVERERSRPLLPPPTISRPSAAATTVSGKPTKSQASKEALASISAALLQRDAQTRMQKICAALSTWAQTDVDAAGAWALAPTDISRDVALAAVIRSGAATHPLATARLVSRLSSENSSEAVELGHDLIFALSKSSQFSLAAVWATSGIQTNPDWIADAYSRWATAQPEEASASARALPDLGAREAAIIATTQASTPDDDSRHQSK